MGKKYICDKEASKKDTDTQDRGSDQRVELEIHRLI